jgi:hypothetical protein
MEDIALSRAMASYTARLDRTLRKLQDRVKEQEAALEKVKVTQLGFSNLRLMNT